MSGNEPGMPGDQSEIDAAFAAIVAGIDGGGEDQHDRLPFSFRPDSGRIRVRLDDPYRTAVVSLVTLARLVLEEDGLIAAEMYPVAYPDDVAAQAEFAETTRATLRDQRLAACDTVLSQLGAETISVDDADAWLRALNEARTLLTRGVKTDEDLENLYETDEVAGAWLALCSVIQEQILEALDEIETLGPDVLG